MRVEWLKLVSQIERGEITQVKCPNCGKCGIDYTYVGDCGTRIGFLQIWCNNCLKGIHISRASAPINAKMVPFNSDLKTIIPAFVCLEE